MQILEKFMKNCTHDRTQLSDVFFDIADTLNELVHISEIKAQVHSLPRSHSDN